MRNWINLVEGYHDGDEIDIEMASQQIVDRVTAFAEPLPITVELRPNYEYGTCRGVILTDLYADEPGNGVGTQVMQMMCSLADEDGISLYTDPDGPRSKAFYEKFGFERSGNSGGPMMARLAPLPRYYSLDEAD